jgi:glycosyltransferase involved in cell wall biosynthesis
VVINNLHMRGRRLGLDIFERVRQEIPLDLIGMGATELNSVGEIPHNELPEFISRYRFFFNPIRYTSLGLAVLEAMTIGLPIVGLATTEMAMVFQNGKNGFVHTNVDRVIEHMAALLADRQLAGRISQAGRSYALQHYNIDRFVRDWCEVMLHVTQNEKMESRANGFHRERVAG